ncbi:ABC transporter substrate-binding protein [Frankia sp. AgB1.9]|uniref:ABC transporter substrate-binding protein n=1 Tax=unclassified Frankia TaxID=2632575 RepID=UPI0019343553|nr:MULTISPECIES: ABC transporter substrate-binding protein [unclassified Frankia]MBL7488486.1 ABC transporter substrate-binding protein [Frankia sp. AgW1.1]MBL7547269.1 ABC transporter substrate-binding protein [Frankia sp. AgB1.9]MBL7620826.1 ABC transporter substrate-binding protein [Frankia sp. AgB1.8]
MRKRTTKRPRRPRTATAIAAVIVGLPAALAGCATGSSASGGNSNGPCTAPGVTADAITIGLIYPDSGAVSGGFRDARSGVDARVALQNASGGVNGRKIVIEWRDDRSDAAGFANAAHDLVDQQHAFGLIAVSIDLPPSADWLQKTGVPVTGIATSADWSQHPNLFHFGSIFNEGAAVDTFGKYVKSENGTKALVLFDPTSSASKDLAGRFTPSLQSQGIQVVSTYPYTENISSPAQVVERLRATGADTLVGAAQIDSFIDIYAAARQAGVKLNVALSSAGYSPSLLRTHGSAIAGMSVMVDYLPFEQPAPAMRTYQKSMADYAPELADPDDEIALGSYVAADEMIKGLEVAGACPTRPAFITNLRQVHDFTGSGLFAPTDLSRPAAPPPCFNFLKVNPTGTGFTTVPGNRPDGFWCGEPVEAAPTRG